MERERERRKDEGRGEGCALVRTVGLISSLTERPNY